MKRHDLDPIAAKVRNWGRWGDDDQRGTLNHVDPAVLCSAAAEVRSGKLFSLAIKLGADGPQQESRRFNPKLYVTETASPLYRHKPSAKYSDDVIHMPLQAATHWDALSHVHYDGELYNGCKACDTLSEKGASRLGIQTLAQPGIIGRGVLIDVARLRGVDALPLDYAITIDDLNAACASQGVVVRKGDVALVRTGHMRRFTIDRDRATFNDLQPGLDPRCAEWIHDHSLAAVAADNIAVEVISAEMRVSEMPLPLHMLCLRDMGCPLGEMFDMEALASDCAADGQYSFLLAAAALPVNRAFGSPINPLALK